MSKEIKETVANCERADEFNVTKNDLTEPDDNSFKCPITGEYIVLVRINNKPTCKSPSCPYGDILD